MQLQIISSTKKLFDGGIKSLQAPTSEGEIGILSNHANFISVLDVGELVIKTEKDEKKLLINGGFIQVRKNNIIILANEAALPKELVAAEIDEAIRKAEEKISSDLPPEELIRLEKQLRYERLKRKVVKVI